MDRNIAEQYADDYMFMACIKFINSVRYNYVPRYMCLGDVSYLLVLWVLLWLSSCGANKIWWKPKWVLPHIGGYVIPLIVLIRKCLLQQGGQLGAMISYH